LFLKATGPNEFLGVELAIKLGGGDLFRDSYDKANGQATMFVKHLGFFSPEKLKPPCFGFLEWMPFNKGAPTTRRF